MWMVQSDESERSFSVQTRQSLGVKIDNPPTLSQMTGHFDP